MVLRTPLSTSSPVTVPTTQSYAWVPARESKGYAWVPARESKGVRASALSIPFTALPREAVPAGPRAPAQADAAPPNPPLGLPGEQLPMSCLLRGSPGLPPSPSPENSPEAPWVLTNTALLSPSAPGPCEPGVLGGEPQSGDTQGKLPGRGLRL